MPRRRLREPFTFFVDECLGAELVPSALRAGVTSGERVVVHREVFPQGVDDETWITTIAAEGWVAITKDARLRHRPNELAAILGAGAAVIMISDGKGEEMARTLASALPGIRRALRVHEVPCVARAERSGSVYVTYSGGEQLRPPRVLKPGRSSRG